jgi:hypothetical protein
LAPPASPLASTGYKLIGLSLTVVFERTLRT